MYGSTGSSQWSVMFARSAERLAEIVQSHVSIVVPTAWLQGTPSAVHRVATFACFGGLCSALVLIQGSCAFFTLRGDSRHSLFLLTLVERSGLPGALRSAAYRTVAAGQQLYHGLQDVVAPGTPAQPTTMEVRVFMQQSKDLTAAAAAECKDKFLIQSTPVPSDWVRLVFEAAL